MDVQSQIWGIPAIVFSGVLSGLVGASIALLGTYLQGLLQANRQTEQLEHDADQRTKEREMALRRDVYLPAAECIAKLQEHLKSYASQTMSNEIRSEITAGVWGHFNKVAIVGSIETIEVFDRLYLKFSQLNEPLCLKHLSIHNIDLEIELLNETQPQIVDQINQLLHLLNSEPNGAMSAGKIDLGNQVASLRASLHSQFEEVKQKRLLQNELRYEISEDISSAVAEIERLMAEANIAIRKELGMPIDEVRYLASVDSTYIQMQETTKKSLEEIRRQIPELIERLEQSSANS